MGIYTENRDNLAVSQAIFRMRQGQGGIGPFFSQVLEYGYNRSRHGQFRSYCKNNLFNDTLILNQSF